MTLSSAPAGRRRRRSAAPRRTSILTVAGLLAAAGATAWAPTAHAAATSPAVTTTVATRCAFLTYQTPVDWYFPSGAAKALVWLQHGFAENKSLYAGYARQLADNGFLVAATTLPSADLFGCTVNNLGNNTAYLNNVATLFGTKDASSGALNASFRAARVTAGRADLAMPQKLAFVGHSAGGEAVSYVAGRLRTAYPATFSQLTGLVLEDPVASPAGSNLATGLSALAPTGVPVYALASPKNSCNADQSGTQQLITSLPGRFHGAQISTGVHQDIYGSDNTALFNLVCGTPKAGNTNAVRTLTTGWLTGFADGTGDPAYFPGGSVYDALQSAGTISTLP
ncbi:alpha/beta hydrolase [Branchiibius hedensis]|uniref:alpha/beta hydrolase n=1 Tax=Branchiibius hedensis TaxID=672460 RepID=UPI0011B28D0C|nr:alpha/beta hydrolase [Branchiibius hedensis]